MADSPRGARAGLDPALLGACVHCGFCLQACPTYRLWGEEADSPRGRIYLMKLAAEDAAPMTPGWIHHMDTCLGCMACVTACPSGVAYDRLIARARAEIERRRARPVVNRIARRLLLSLLSRPERLRWFSPLLRVYQRAGLRALLHRTGAHRRLPAPLRTMEALLPPIASGAEIPAVTAARGPRRARVGVVLGCVQRALLPEVNAATVRVLAAEGCEVVAPPDQSCCGALMSHVGERAAAGQRAMAMIAAFADADLDAIVVNAAGCGSAMKEYGDLLAEASAWAERAVGFAARCRDVAELLAALGPRAERHPLPLRVALHDPCHLRHAQRIYVQPRELLATVPGLEVVEIPENEICCGSAGVYNLLQPEPARALGDRKAELIARLDVDVVATGNIGCILQLRAALERCGRPLAVVHTVQLLDAAIRGADLDDLRPPARWH